MVMFIHNFYAYEYFMHLSICVYSVPIRVTKSSLRLTVLFTDYMLNIPSLKWVRCTFAWGKIFLYERWTLVYGMCNVHV